MRFRYTLTLAIGLLASIQAQFEGDFQLHYHLAPPLLAPKNAQGELQKRKLGPGVRWAFLLLARLKGLRGTPFDPFGYQPERRTVNPDPGPGHAGGTVVNALLHRVNTPVLVHADDEPSEDAEELSSGWPGLVHRLDHSPLVRGLLAW